MLEHYQNSCVKSMNVKSRLCYDNNAFPKLITVYISENSYCRCPLQTRPWIDPCQWTSIGQHWTKSYAIQTPRTTPLVGQSKYWHENINKIFANWPSTMMICFSLSRKWVTMILPLCLWLNFIKYLIFQFDKLPGIYFILCYFSRRSSPVLISVFA